MKSNNFWKWLLLTAGFVLVCLVAKKADKVDLKVDLLEEETKTLQGKFDSVKVIIEELRGERVVIIHVPQEAYFCDERLPLEDHWVRKRFVEQLKYYGATAAGQRRVELYLREAEGTFPYVETRTRELSLPTDLKYVPAVESEFNDEARSYRGAVGRWQFMPGTGKEMGLIINKKIDERKHFEKATEAAFKKLASEYEIFKNWALTLAAYNVGVKRMKEELKDQPSADSSYFNLDLNKETREYVYRLAALKYVLENPERYGFEQQPYEGIKIQVVEYKLKKSKRLVEIAKELEISPAEFRELNRWIEGNELPKGTYHLRLPNRKNF